MAEMTPEELSAAISAANWAGSKIRSETKARTDSDVAKAATMLEMESTAAKDAVEIGNLTTFFAAIGSNPVEAIDALITSGFGLIGYLVHKVSGLKIEDDLIRDSLLLENNEGMRLALGQVVTTFFDENMRPEQVQADYLNRESGPGAKANMERIIGASLRLQIGDMVADWGTQAIPFGLASGLKDIAERLDKAIALEDSLEEVVQVYIEGMISEPLKQMFNRILLPKDYTYSEAGQLHIMGKLDRATMDKVWDNEGIRKDTRENQLDLMAKNFTDSEVRQMWERGLIDEDGIIAHFRDQVCTEDIAKRRAELVTRKREWELADSLTSAYLSAFSGGRATEAEVRQWLASENYTEREIDLALQIAKLKSRNAGGLTKSELKKALLYQLLSPEEVLAELQKDGLTLRDATIVLIEMLEDNLPDGKKPTDCQKLEGSAVTAFLGKLATEIGLSGPLTAPALLKYLQECVLK